MRARSLFFLFLLPPAACADHVDPDLERVLDRHRAGLGGQPAIDAVGSVQIDLAIEEPPYSLVACYVATRDGRMRIDVYDDDVRVFSEGFDGNDGWQLPAGTAAAAPMSAAGEAAVRRGIVGNLFGLHERPTLGYELRFVATEPAVRGGEHWVIDSIAPDGFRERLYVDSDSGRIERRSETSSLHPDDDPEEHRFVTRVSDYRERGGRWFPFRTEKFRAATGAGVQRTTVTRLVVNPALPDDVFSADGPVLRPAG